MQQSASLCFCKLLNPSASERLLISNTLEASTPLRLCLPRREIDIIVPIVFIVPIVSIITIITIITIPPFYRFFPCNPCYPCYPSFHCYRRAFQAIAFPIIFEAEAYPFHWADATKNREPSDLTPDYSFPADAFPILIEAKTFPILIEAKAFPFISSYRLSDLFRLNACIKKLSF